MNAEPATAAPVARLDLGISRDRLLLLFCSSNLGFLVFDVAIAHSVNSFVPAYEWIPIFAPLPGVVTALWLALARRPAVALQLAHAAMMLVSLVVGVMGTAFHAMAIVPPGGGLAWAWVIFGAPVLAPLSFAGVGLVGLMPLLREDPARPGRLVWGVAVLSAPLSREQHLFLLLALGLLGAAVTSFLDHGQYGYTRYEWIPVAAGTFATILVLARVFTPRTTRADQVAFLWTMVAMVLVGVVGFAFHLSHDLADSGAMSFQRMRAFAPVFAPLLFADLGLLGLVLTLTGDPPPRSAA